MAKIIVADDELTHRELVEAMLERAGHHVTAVAGGIDCLMLLEAEEADLVVTDIFMPDLDGYKLVMNIRGSGREIPIIGMSGGMRGVTAPFVGLLHQLGACKVLVKPFSANDLLAAVDEALGAAAA
jgi:CheY-like chemotaxis protein